MNTEEKILLAEEIAKELVGVERNEWQKWVEYVKVKGNLDRGLILAQFLSTSPMLRERPQRSYQTIQRAIEARKAKLKAIPFIELQEIFGYVGRILFARLSDPLEGMLKRGIVSREQRRPL